MLSTEKLIGFTATANPSEAKMFYETTLGLKLIEDSPYALVFAAGATTIRVQKVQTVVVSGYTALGWQVNNIAKAVQELSARGVKFQKYEGLPQDETGVWRTPDGSAVAWFKDPDGNTLSITEFKAA
jgi:catechol 2,3-dioxygenase-like lactoylglutathione lyase family enzyme